MFSMYEEDGLKGAYHFSARSTRLFMPAQNESSNCARPDYAASSTRWKAVAPSLRSISNRSTMRRCGISFFPRSRADRRNELRSSDRTGLKATLHADL